MNSPDAPRRAEVAARWLTGKPLRDLIADISPAAAADLTGVLGMVGEIIEQRRPDIASAIASGGPVSPRGLLLPDTSLEAAAHEIQTFAGDGLTARLAALESDLRGMSRLEVQVLLQQATVSPSLLRSALTIKAAARQINTLVHAVGVLLALPFILEEDEVVEALSLGAGNTGRAFDLETDRRVAEFTFIDWQGRSETIRQNAVFDDFFRLAEAKTPKARFLYLKGTTHAMKFLGQGRSLESIFRKNGSLGNAFRRTYGDQFKRVHEYYEYRRDRVEIVDLLTLIRSIFS